MQIVNERADVILERLERSREMKKGAFVLFILGAGASADSGMKTYRGSGETYYANEESLHARELATSGGRKEIWRQMDAIAKDAAKVEKPGHTYARIAEIANESEKVVVLTQNIDGLAERFLPPHVQIYELHGSLKQLFCMKCKETCPYVRIGDHTCPFCKNDLSTRPNVVLFGEDILPFPFDFRPQIVYIVGTTMRFPYLHKIVKRIKSKSSNCAVIHVNNDPAYDEHIMRNKTVWKNGGEPHVTRRKRKKPEKLIEKL